MTQESSRWRTVLLPYLVLCLICYLKGCRGDAAKKGVVIAADAECRQIGSDFLNIKQGSAIDATIATMLCLGVKMPHAMGIGGGFNMVVYDRKSEQVEHIDGREVSPMATDTDLFNRTDFLNNPNHLPMIKMGLLSIAIPGELAGYWTAHQRHGKLPWSELFKPAIKLARYGHPMTYYTSAAINWWSKMRFDHSEFGTLCKILCRPDGSLKQTEDDIKMLKLADTLELIANKGPSVFYNGELTDKLVEELNSQLHEDKHLTQFIPAGTQYFTREDFKNYEAKIRKPFTIKIGNLTMHAPTSPGGGPVLGFNLKLLEGYNLNVSHEGMDPVSEVKYYHRLAEVMKYGFAHRFQMGDSEATRELIKKMADNKYIDRVRNGINDVGYINSSFYADKLAKLDDGTLHISVMSANGDAVSVTSSINLPLGSYHVSESTGIIFNNQMHDFTYPDYNDTKYYTVNHDANIIGPSKRPQSSQSPAIFIDNDGEVRYVVGAAGGRFIIPAITQVVSSMLWLGDDVYTAIDKARFTHTLIPFTLRYEKEFNESITRVLDILGQKTSFFDTLPCIGRVEVIKQHQNGTIQGYSDKRKFVT